MTVERFKLTYFDGHSSCQTSTTERNIGRQLSSQNCRITRHPPRSIELRSTVGAASMGVPLPLHHHSALQRLPPLVYASYTRVSRLWGVAPLVCWSSVFSEIIPSPGKQPSRGNIRPPPVFCPCYYDVTLRFEPCSYLQT